MNAFELLQARCLYAVPFILISIIQMSLKIIFILKRKLFLLQPSGCGQILTATSTVQTFVALLGNTTDPLESDFKECTYLIVVNFPSVWRLKKFSEKTAPTNTGCTVST